MLLYKRNILCLVFLFSASTSETRVGGKYEIVIQ